MKLTLLESVGTFIDTDTGDTYPQMKNGGLDFARATNVCDMSPLDDWTRALSPSDAATVERVLLAKGNQCH